MKLLVASADPKMRELVRTVADRIGFGVLSATDGSEALARLNNEAPAVLVLDHPLADCDATHLLTTARRKAPMLMALAVIDPIDASERDRLLRAGVDELVEKPLGGHGLARRLEALLGKALTHNQFNILGTSRAVQELRNMIRLIGPTFATVLITGESGVGKELVAKALHGVSARRGEVFVAVNAAALASSVLESELFGHEKGAFTGADSARKGKFEAASRGTLFLDEIGEIDLSTQIKLLRVLEDGRFARVGGNVDIQTGCRVIAATNKNLGDAVEEGDFRRDLYYRLKIVEIQVPPLREHAEDVPTLWEHFAAEVAARNSVIYGGTDPLALDTLREHRWPGNVRELRNAAERAVLLAQGQPVRRDHLPSEIHSFVSGSSANLPAPIVRSREEMERAALYQSLVALRAEIAEIKTILLQMQAMPAPQASRTPIDPISAPAREPGPILVPDEDNYASLDEMESQMIQRALFDFDGNRKRAAKALGISERTLYRKLKELDAR